MEKSGGAVKDWSGVLFTPNWRMRTMINVTDCLLPLYDRAIHGRVTWP